jgi:hypothetical protein
VVYATLREVLILCDDGCLLLKRVPPDFGVVGFTAGFTQQPRQRGRQLSIDNEFHGTLRTAWSA